MPLRWRRCHRNCAYRSRCGDVAGSSISMSSSGDPPRACARSIVAVAEQDRDSAMPSSTRCARRE
jgi:hypothetical protein